MSIKYKSAFLFILMFGILFYSSCTNKKSNNQRDTGKNTISTQQREFSQPQFLNTWGWVIIGDAVFDVEIAESDDEIQCGLMFRQELSGDNGMLFVFAEESLRSFWMKNVPVPLSIAFINKEGVVVSISEMNAMDETTIPSVAPAMYALEVRKGRFAELGVVVGDLFQWDYN